MSRHFRHVGRMPSHYMMVRSVKAFEQLGRNSPGFDLERQKRRRRGACLDLLFPTLFAGDLWQA